MSFQSVYDWIKGWKAPLWLKTLLQQLNDLMIVILKEAGQAYVNMLKEKIIEAASHKDWTSEQKFQYVWSAAKNGTLEFAVTIKDNEINALIEFLVAQMKKGGVII